MIHSLIPAHQLVLTQVGRGKPKRRASVGEDIADGEFLRSRAFERQFLPVCRVTLPRTLLPI